MEPQVLVKIFNLETKLTAIVTSNKLMIIRTNINTIIQPICKIYIFFGGGGGLGGGGVLFEMDK